MTKFFINSKSLSVFILDLDTDIMYCWGTTKFHQCSNIMYKEDVFILEYK